MKFKPLDQGATDAPVTPVKLTNEGGLVFETGPELLENSLEVLDGITDEHEFDRQLLALEAAYPANPSVFRARIQRLIKRKQFEAAVQLIDARDVGTGADALLEKASLLYDSRDHARAGEIFAGLIEEFPERRDVRAEYAKRLLSDGFLVRAHRLLFPIRDSFTEGTKSQQLVDKTMALFSLLSRLEEDPLLEDQDARILAMKHAILRFRGRPVAGRDEAGLGRLTLITGSLGPGGAERQLTRLAMELERAREESGAIAGIPLDRPVEILVRSHGPEKQNDFYLAEVKASGCELRQINEFKPLSYKALGVEDRTLELLLDFLPPAVNYGCRRLTEYFRNSGTQTASIWQDGACLFASLAALLAGVPHIQLAIRGLPPSMRRHMYRPEYEVLYRAMAEVPGVRFVSNNKSAARAYADWLELSPHRFDIVYNGVEPMRAEPSAECAKKWDDFIAATPEAHHTIGGVFRFDTDKQPLLWIRFAARYLRRHPESRFVLVGAGRLLPNAEALAEELGIADRILFVGRSNRVGYWMSKMDVLVLLSRYEGLPNVLIEAQYMGVRVVTTPAGGAAECLIDGTTGYVLECAEKPDLEGVVAKAHALALRSPDRELFKIGGAARQFLDSHFSVPRMLEEYVRCTADVPEVQAECTRERQRRVA